MNGMLLVLRQHAALLCLKIIWHRVIWWFSTTTKPKWTIISLKRIINFFDLLLLLYHRDWSCRKIGYLLILNLRSHNQAKKARKNIMRWCAFNQHSNWHLRVLLPAHENAKHSQVAVSYLAKNMVKVASGQRFWPRFKYYIGMCPSVNSHMITCRFKKIPFKILIQIHHIVIN